MLVDAENVSKMTLGLVGEVGNQSDIYRAPQLPAPGAPLVSVFYDVIQVRLLFRGDVIGASSLEGSLRGVAFAGLRGLPPEVRGASRDCGLRSVVSQGGSG